MKKEIIIFQNRKPKTRKEICYAIEHFCKDHNCEYQLLSHRGAVKFYMDGILYQTELEKEYQDASSYWMIRCRHQPA